MQLLTNELRKQLPPLYATEHNPDPLAICKFFAPGTACTWYITEFDGEDTLFGLYVGGAR